MTHEEAIAIKIYYEAIHHSYENDVDLRYTSLAETTFYQDSKLTMNEYNYVFGYMYFGEESREN